MCSREILIQSFIMLMIIIPNTLNALELVSTTTLAESQYSHYPYLNNATVVFHLTITQLNPHLFLDEIPTTDILCGRGTTNTRIVRVYCRKCHSQAANWFLKYAYSTSDYLFGVSGHVYYLDENIDFTGDNTTRMNEILNQYALSPSLQLYGAQYTQNNLTVKSYSTTSMSRKNQHVIIDIAVACRQPRGGANSQQTIYLSGEFGVVPDSSFSYWYIVLSMAIVISLCALGCITLFVCALCEKRTRKNLRRYSVILKNNNAWSMMKEEEISSFDESQRQFKEIGYVNGPLNV